MFGEHGIGISLLTYGPNWRIQPWVEGGRPKLTTAEAWRSLGELIAQMHAIDTNWMEPWKEKAVLTHPELADAESHLWLHAYQCLFGWRFLEQSIAEGSEEKAKKLYFDAKAFAPRTSAGRRIVTSHIDI